MYVGGVEQSQGVRCRCVGVGRCCWGVHLHSSASRLWAGVLQGQCSLFTV